VVPCIARGGDGVSPAASRPGSGGQPDQLRIGWLAPAAEIGRELGRCLIHATQRSRNTAVTSRNRSLLPIRYAELQHGHRTKTATVAGGRKQPRQTGQAAWGSNRTD